MQAETVAPFTGGKTVRENTGQVFRGNANAIIGDNNVDDAFVRSGDRDAEFLVGTLNVVQCVFRVANQIDKNLQNLMPVDPDRRHGREPPLNFDSMALKSADIHGDGVLYQPMGLEIFKNAA